MNRSIRSILTVVALTLSSPALAGQQTVRLSVPGMYCSACPTIVKGSLQKVAGVTKVEISLEQRTAVVTFDDGKASVADLVKATTNAGYPSSQVTAAAQ
jgi:periplasmic mercuric ion binding protein